MIQEQKMVIAQLTADKENLCNELEQLEGRFEATKEGQFVSRTETTPPPVHNY